MKHAIVMRKHCLAPRLLLTCAALVAHQSDGFRFLGHRPLAAPSTTARMASAAPVDLDATYSAIAAAQPEQQAAYEAWVASDAVDAAALTAQAAALGLTLDIVSGTIAYAPDFESKRLALDFDLVRGGGAREGVGVARPMRDRFDLRLPACCGSAARRNAPHPVDTDAPNDELYCRHGKTTGNTEPRVYQGYVDEPSNALNEIGLAQAEDAADLLDELAVEVRIQGFGSGGFGWSATPRRRRLARRSATPIAVSRMGRPCLVPTVERGRVRVLDELVLTNTIAEEVPVTGLFRSS